MGFSCFSKTITCLDVSTNGLTLVSGSLDETVKLWDIPSRQCLRTLTHKGGITNAFFVFLPLNAFSSDSPKPTLQVKSFQRRIEDVTRCDDVVEVTLTNKTDIVWGNRGSRIKRSYSSMNDDHSPNLEEQVLQLKTANKQLYQHVLNTIMSKNT